MGFFLSEWGSLQETLQEDWECFFLFEGLYNTILLSFKNLILVYISMFFVKWLSWLFEGHWVLGQIFQQILNTKQPISEDTFRYEFHIFQKKWDLKVGTWFSTSNKWFPLKVLVVPLELSDLQKHFIPFNAAGMGTSRWHRTMCRYWIPWGPWAIRVFFVAWLVLQKNTFANRSTYINLLQSMQGHSTKSYQKLHWMILEVIITFVRRPT